MNDRGHSVSGADDRRRHADRRSLPRRLARRLRRDGRRLLRRGPAARTPRRRQAAARALRRGRGVRRALPPRGLERRRRSRTPTSSASTTAASGTAPTTSRWSTSTGRSLDSIVREEAPLTPRRAIEITEQVLRAARFAHRRGVVHRDLKPHNVILDEEGRVKVTDFGIARAGASEMTQTGSIMGTARYLSPEQAQGHAVSEASRPLLDRRHALRAADRARSRSRASRS